MYTGLTKRVEDDSPTAEAEAQVELVVLIAAERLVEGTDPAKDIRSKRAERDCVRFDRSGGRLAP